MVVILKHLHLISRILRLNEPRNIILKRAAKTSCSRSAEAVFIEKSLEDPIIAVTDKENVDMIGPPDPVSNLRPIIRKISLDETELQLKLRLMQDDVQNWNQEFWAGHNTRFIKERQEYVKNKLVELKENRTLTADEMSEFYKKFLDENWKTHVTYNIQWYQRNFRLLFLALRASLPPSLHFL